MIQTPSLACMFGANQYIFSFGYVKAQLTFFQPFFTFISSTDSPANIMQLSYANSLGVACPRKFGRSFIYIQNKKGPRIDP